MRFIPIFFLLCLFSCRPSTPTTKNAVSTPPVSPPIPIQESPVWNVHFSPRGGCTEEVVGLIDSAKTTVKMQAYGFTSPEIEAALERAKTRNVDVQIILDRSNNSEKSSQMTAAKAAGVTVYIDSKHAIAHNKVIITDSTTVETGSFNYTTAAEKSNAENCLVLLHPSIASAYDKNWEDHKAHSTQSQ